ncbi:type II secretion system F family protein [Pelagibacterium lacus]|uniref:Type II secretion system F family protein n=1 Tax=Pelagibacterium lacus TaxID=2282655 RepID=A0A369W9I0_9HYPH|nr:type II secretion system F family protein [Pelagibacterium lacus]RDE10020.1 type II secretion system F family protein [Pelagibacterium lacus]
MVERLVSPDFLIALFAAISAAAIVFTFGAHLFERIERKDRMKKVALEREQLRAREMARLRNQAGSKEAARGNIRGADARSYMKSTVERFSLQKAFMDENTMERLAQAGLRGQGELTKHLFLRFVTPFVLLGVAALYLLVISPGGRPLFINLVYAIGVGLVGAYLPLLLLKNRTQKRQQSVKRAWPDALDLMLLCVEAGMSIEHSIKRVAREIGLQSPELAEELTLTTAELSFLEDRTRAYDNLARRTGLDGVRSVMTALIQAERYGTSVGQALRVMAEEGREMRMNEAEKKAAALPPKMTVPLILFFLPVLFIVIMAPAIITAMAL